MEAKIKMENIGSNVRFTYKGGRKVCGEVLFIDEKIVILKLETDYIGKNQEWYKGEKKQFNISEIKKVKTPKDCK